jgi:hypothetical protein
MRDHAGAPTDPVYRVLWTESLEDVDREILRLALVCQVRLLEPGVIRQVLDRDASVCGAPNARAFGKLHDLIVLHLAMREKSLASFGSRKTVAMENYVIERLRPIFPQMLERWPPA